MKTRKGIILAGGSGTRLYPVTSAISKQLLPVYNKPMIYYPLSVLMLAGIREIAIITTSEDSNQFKTLMGDGRQWGLSLSYIEQARPDGIAQAFILAEKFLNGSPSALILGDNIFYGNGLSELLIKANQSKGGGTAFAYEVSEPERYGVVGFDPEGFPKNLEEKPTKPASNYAVTGLYFLDATASERAKLISFSKRGELEITSLLEMYMEEKTLIVEKLSRGYAWLDTGTHESLLDAGNFVRTLQYRQGLEVGSPEEVALSMGWISKQELEERIVRYGINNYSRYLTALLQKQNNE